MRVSILSRRRSLPCAALLALVCVAAPSADAAPDPREQLATLSGTWSSTAPEPWGPGAWGTREFRFDNGRWALHFVLALDPKMQNRVFDFRTSGLYFLGPRSARVPGAFDALFLEDRKQVTLRTGDRQLVAAFGLAGCGLNVDVEKDISTEGCAGWKPVAVCNEDHDLLALDADGGVRFGQRPRDNDMCTADKRPTALLPAVVRR